MRTTTIFVVAIVVVIGVIILFGFNRIADRDTMTVTEQRAIENDPAIVLETETEATETLPPGVEDADPQVEVPIDNAEAPVDPDAPDVLTVEGYDPQRVRFLLQASDMPVALRNEYIARLDAIAADDDALAAVLRQLREDLEDLDAG